MLIRNGLHKSSLTSFAAYVPLNTSTIINHPATAYDTLDGASIIGFHAQDDGGDAGVARINNYIPWTIGNKYLVTFSLTLTSGTAPSYAPTINHGSSIIGGASGQLATAGFNSYIFIPTASSSTGSFSFYNLSTATEYTVSDFRIVQL